MAGCISHCLGKNSGSVPLLRRSSAGSTASEKHCFCEAVAHRGRHCRPDRAGGFTLLEVLVATALSATLLAVLWGLFGIYLRLFETGQARTEQAQLARVLLQQLADDLHSAIEDSPGDDPADAPAGSAGAATSVRRFGLLGSSQWLRFDVLQAVPLERAPSLDTDVSEALWGSHTSQVPELRTIYYRFQRADEREEGEQSELSPEEPNVRPGLTRSERDFETPYQENARRAPGRVLTVRSPSSDTEDVPATESSAVPDTFSADPSITWAPEVVGLQFRYFDGRGWSSQWDSLKRESLPVAIEAIVQMRAYGERQSATYRLVVNLPSARQRPDVAAAQRTARRPPAAPQTPRPLVPPRLRVPGPLTIKPTFADPIDAPQPDQWIRTGPS